MKAELHDFSGFSIPRAAITADAILHDNCNGGITSTSPPGAAAIHSNPTIPSSPKSDSSHTSTLPPQPSPASTDCMPSPPPSLNPGIAALASIAAVLSEDPDPAYVQALADVNAADAEQSELDEDADLLADVIKEESLLNSIMGCVVDVLQNDKYEWGYVSWCRHSFIGRPLCIYPKHFAVIK